MRRTLVARISGALFMLIAMLVAAAAFAQDAPAPAAAPAAVAVPAGPERPKLIRDKIVLLEQQVDALTKQLGGVVGPEAPAALRERIAALQAELDEISVQIGEMQGKNQTQDTSAGEHTARLEAMAAEIEKLWAENKVLAEKVTTVDAKSLAGYDKGFYIRSDDKKFQLTINGYVKPYYKVEFQEQWEKDKYGELVYDETTQQPIGGDTEAIINEFGLSAARLALKVKLFGFATGVFEPDFHKTTGKVEYPANADVGDAKFNRVKIAEHTLTYKAAYGEIEPFEWLVVRGGQFKVGFDRETLISSNQLTFTGMSLMTGSYKVWGDYMANDGLAYHWDYGTRRGSSFSYDRGLQVAGKVWEKRFSYAAGVYNGGGTSKENDNTNLMYAVRLAIDTMGEMSKGMSDLDCTQKPLLSIGAAFVYDRPENKSPLSPQDKKLNYYSEDINLTGDLLFKWNGLHVLGSLFYRHADHGNAYGEPKAIDTLGYMGQAGWYFPQVGLEPAIRYSGMDASIDRQNDNAHEITGALNYYVKGHDLKLQAEYTALMMADMTRTYLAPYGTWEDYHHSLTIMAQLGF